MTGAPAQLALPLVHRDTKPANRERTTIGLWFDAVEAGWDPGPWWAECPSREELVEILRARSGTGPAHPSTERPS